MIFNFFKKDKKKSDIIETVSRIESGQLKAPKINEDRPKNVKLVNNMKKTIIKIKYK